MFFDSGVDASFCGTNIYLATTATGVAEHALKQAGHEILFQNTEILDNSEDAGHRDWRNVRKTNLQNTAKEPEKPTTTIVGIVHESVECCLPHFYSMPFCY